MKLVRYLCLFTLLASIKVSGQDERSVCGYIENEQLTIPSYKFEIFDKTKGSLGNLQMVGTLEISEPVWKKGGFLDMDPYWDAMYHNITIPVTYDAKQGVYISQELPKIAIAHRKKNAGWGGKPNCWDRVEKLKFEYATEDGKMSWFFLFFFPNRKIDKISLPNNKEVIRLAVGETFRDEPL